MYDTFGNFAKEEVLLALSRKRGQVFKFAFNGLGDLLFPCQYWNWEDNEYAEYDIEKFATYPDEIWIEVDHDLCVLERNLKPAAYLNNLLKKFTEIVGEKYVEQNELDECRQFEIDDAFINSFGKFLEKYKRGS